MVQTVPRIVHFIHGLADAPPILSYSEHLAVLLASRALPGYTLNLHYHHEPTGQFWHKTKSMLTLRQVELPTSIFNRPLRHHAHRADVLRLRVLLEHGGLYLDLDVLVLRDFAPIFDAAAKAGFAIAREGDAQHGGEHGLCNAVLVAAPNSSFASRWLASYSSFGSSALDPWNGHSVTMPLRLAQAHPASVFVLDYDAFFWPDWDEEPLAQLLLERTDPLAIGTDGRGRFALHLWHHIAEPFVLSQWSPAYLSAVASSLNCILSRHVAPPLARGAARNCSCARLGSEARGGRAAPMGRWELGAADDDERLLVDSSGECLHGWVYASAGSAYRVSAAFFGADALAFSSPLEAFIPLPRDTAQADVTLSWWGAARSRWGGCGGAARWWTLSLGDGATLGAGVESSGGLLAPALLERRGRRAANLLLAPASSVCNNGWHHYVVSVSASARRLALHVDGSEVGTATWSARGAFGGSVPPTRGLWVGGEDVRITERTPRRASVDADSHLRMARLELFEGALTPAELPIASSRPEAARGWSPEPIAMPPRSPLAELLVGAAAAEPPGAECAACAGRLRQAEARLPHEASAWAAQPAIRLPLAAGIAWAAWRARGSRRRRAIVRLAG